MLPTANQHLRSDTNLFCPHALSFESEGETDADEIRQDD